MRDRDDAEPPEPDRPPRDSDDGAATGIGPDDESGPPEAQPLSTTVLVAVAVAGAILGLVGVVLLVLSLLG